VTSIGQGLPADVPTDIAAHPDFTNHPVLFVSMASTGVFSRDLSQPGSTWTPVGTGMPPYRCESLALSPDFGIDGMVFAGTAYGLWAADLLAGGQWTSCTTGTLIDEKDEEFTTYAPLHPSNPEPTHAWPWVQVWRAQFPSQQEMLDKRVLVATTDLSEARIELDVQIVDVLTYRSSGLGTLVVRALDPDSGALLAIVRDDLSQGGQATWPPQLHTVRLQVPPGTGRFELVMTAHLDAGESLPIDGLEVVF